MRSRTARYLVIGYVVKTLLLGIAWVLVPEWPDWTRTLTAPMLAIVGCRGVAARPERGTVGRFVYVANPSEKKLYGFQIEPVSGALNPVPAPPVTLPGESIAVAAAPSGRFVYVLLSSGQIAGYSVSDDRGALRPLPGSPFGTQRQVLWTISVSSALAVDPLGRFLYSINDPYSKTVQVSWIDGEAGTLTEVSRSPVAMGASAAVAVTAVVASPSGDFVYCLAATSSGKSLGQGLVAAFKLESGRDVLEPVPGSPFQVPGIGTHSLAVDARAGFLFAANHGQALGQKGSGLSFLAIDATTGALRPVPGSPFVFAGCCPEVLSASSVPGVLYTEDITVGVGATTASLRERAGLGRTMASAVDPSGRFLFAAIACGSRLTIHGFSIAPDSGRLSTLDVPAPSAGRPPMTASIAIAR